MTRYQVVLKRIVSPNGQVIAQAKSVVVASGDRHHDIHQTVSVKITEGNISSSTSCSRLQG